MSWNWKSHFAFWAVGIMIGSAATLAWPWLGFRLLVAALVVVAICALVPVFNWLAMGAQVPLPRRRGH